MKTHLVASSIALLASCACFASANASADMSAGGPRLGDGYLILVDTQVCLVPPAPGTPCIPRFNLNPPYPRKRTQTPQSGPATPLPGRNGTVEIPPTAQGGRPMRITGPFDGDSSNTSLTATVSTAPVLAESPRTVIVTSPSQTGPTNITADANGAEAKGQLRNIGVSLSAPKTTLRRGERTTTTVEVQGLQNLSKPAR